MIYECTDTPTIDGWYWIDWSASPEDEPVWEILHCTQHPSDGVWMADGETLYGGKFYGPIEPPIRQSNLNPTEAFAMLRERFGHHFDEVEL